MSKKNFEDFKKILVLDTEFIRTKTYYPILSLIQFRYSEIDEIKIFDVLENQNPNDYQDLLNDLQDENVVKVFHSASQDLEAIKFKFGFVVHNVFDTQIALKYMEFGNDIGYGTAVSKVLGIEIEKDKKLQFSHWQRRPLTAEQISYAKQDVEFLHRIYFKAIDFFQQSENYDKYLKFQNDMFILAEKLKAPFDPYLFWKNKKLRHFSYQQNIQLQEMLALREKIARYKNLPREFIIKKNILTSLIESQDINSIKLPKLMNKNTLLNIMQQKN